MKKEANLNEKKREQHEKMVERERKKDVKKSEKKRK